MSVCWVGSGRKKQARADKPHGNGEEYVKCRVLHPTSRLTSSLGLRTGLRPRGKLAYGWGNQMEESCRLGQQGQGRGKFVSRPGKVCLKGSARFVGP